MSLAMVSRLMAMTVPTSIVGLMLERKLNDSLTSRMFQNDPSAIAIFAVMAVVLIACLVESAMFVRSPISSIQRRHRAKPWIALGMCQMGLAFVSFDAGVYSPTLAWTYFAFGSMTAMLGVRIASTDEKFSGVRSV